MRKGIIISLLLLLVKFGNAQSQDSIDFYSTIKEMEDSIDFVISKYHHNRLENVCKLVEMENKLGYWYTNHNLFDKALKYHYSALSHMDGLYHNSGNFQFALSSTYNYIGIVFAQQNQLEIAASFYWKAYRMDTSDNIVLNNYIASLNQLAYSKSSDKDYNEADKYLSRIFEILPDSLPERLLNSVSSSYNLKAYLHAYANDFIEAHRFIDKAISLTPLEPNVYDSKGEFYIMQNDIKKAKDMWEHVLLLDSGFYKTHHSILNEKILKYRN